MTNSSFFPFAPPILPTPDFSDYDDFGKSELYRIQGRKNRFFFLFDVSIEFVDLPFPPHITTRKREKKRRK